MLTTNIYYLSQYTSNIVLENVDNMNNQFNMKQKKITGAASSLVSEDVLLPSNSCFYVDTLGKLTLDTSVDKNKLELLDGLEKPIVNYFSDITMQLSDINSKLTILKNSLREDLLYRKEIISNERKTYFETVSYEIYENLFTSSLDGITQGQTQKYIKDNIHEGNLRINGNLTASNILVKGDTFTLNTDIYKANQLEIISPIDDSNPTIKISNLGNKNTLELKSELNENAFIVSHTGKVGINTSDPQFSLDVNGIVNIDSDFNFKVENRNLSFQDLEKPSTFPPSVHSHDMSDIQNIDSILATKQNLIEGVVWDETNQTLNVGKNINLGPGFVYKLNDISTIWEKYNTNTLRNGLININTTNVSINSAYDSSKTGFYGSDNNIIVYNGNVQALTGNITSFNTIIKTSILLNNADETHKWRIYQSGSEYDLMFENSVDNGINWNLRAKMHGSTEYGLSVFTNFTGIHHCKAMSKYIYSDKYIGYIVSTTNKFCGMNSIFSDENIQRHFDTNSWDFLPVVSLSSKQYDKSVFGVIAKIEGNDPNERYETCGNFTFPIEKKEFDRRLHIAGTGEGGIWVCDYNGNFESGDYITTSPLSGVGMKQDDDIVHNFTVGKITMNCDFNPKIWNSNIGIHHDIITSNDDLINTPEYDMQYLNNYGIVIDRNKYIDLQNSNIPVYKMAFVGCSYTCS